MTTPTTSTELIFEGSEKRLELYFHGTQNTPEEGLRTLSRQQIDGLLAQVSSLVPLDIRHYIP